MTRKEMKVRAKELKIRCFNLMSREELDEAIKCATPPVDGPRTQRLVELQILARTRFKKPSKKS